MARVRQEWDTLVIYLSGLERKSIYDMFSSNLAVGDREYSAAQVCELNRIIKRAQQAAPASTSGLQNPVA